MEAPGREEELEEGGMKDCLVLLVPVLAGHGDHSASHAGHPDPKNPQYTLNHSQEKGQTDE